MPQGSLEVFLVNAKGLENTDFLCKMDPYVILMCRTQEQKSSVASGQGSEPDWNENFIFNVSEGVSDLRLKIMDSDSTTAHDLVGEVTIPLNALFSEGTIPPTPYNVVKDGKYCGEIKIGLTFTPQGRTERCLEEDFGGWKESGDDNGVWSFSSDLDLCACSGFCFSGFVFHFHVFLFCA
ncbi:hypothetical protein VNO78_10417 [Psophocarpus tetragonolobus]|uniref:C2 domain-containing protein n=1 Tax=Psophocarpus tetragonolobus TaxID=3891 RepID=A0AAN9SRE2_PSOTE